MKFEYENLSVYFEATLIWKTIHIQAFQDTSVAIFIAENIINEVSPDDIKSKTDDLIYKMLLVGLIGSKYRNDPTISSSTSNIYDRFISSVAKVEMIYEKEQLLFELVYLLKESIVCADFFFVFDLLRAIEPNCTPAIILNFIELFSIYFKSNNFDPLFDSACHLFFHQSILIQTITETCTLL